MENKKRGSKKKQTNFISHVNAMKRQEAALDAMHPVFRWHVEALIDHLNNKGWQAFVWQGKNRSAAQAAENAKKGTGIKMSWHRPEVYGRLGSLVVELNAADIVDERWGWEGPAGDLDHAFWNDLGGFAKARGLEWGGDWPKRDVAHVQMKLIDMATPDSAVV
jgi:hypothetical protein